MTFHPESLKLTGSLKSKNDSITERTVLCQGMFFHVLECHALLAVGWQMNFFVYFCGAEKAFLSLS